MKHSITFTCLVVAAIGTLNSHLCAQDFAGRLDSVVPMNSPVDLGRDLVYAITVENFGATKWPSRTSPDLHPSWTLLVDDFDWATTLSSVASLLFEPVFPGDTTTVEKKLSSRTDLPTIPGNYSFLVHGYFPEDDSFSWNFASMDGSPKALFFSIKKPGVPPTNDSFAGRAMLRGPELVLPDLTTASSSKEPGEPTHTANPGGSSVWYQWTAPASGVATIDLGGSDFDTLVGVYSGSDLSSLVEIASDDDSGAGAASKVTFDVEAGTSYQIAIDGFNGAWGFATLKLRLEPTFQVVSLGKPTLSRGRGVEFSLSGPAGQRIRVEVSSDLRTWLPLVTVENLAGSVLVQDPNAGPFPQRFYRAVLVQ